MSSELKNEVKAEKFEELKQVEQAKDLDYEALDVNKKEEAKEEEENMVDDKLNEFYSEVNENLNNKLSLFAKQNSNLF
jgi:hypothetical protein